VLLRCSLPARVRTVASQLKTRLCRAVPVSESLATQCGTFAAHVWTAVELPLRSLDSQVLCLHPMRPVRVVMASVASVSLVELAASSVRAALMTATAEELQSYRQRCAVGMPGMVHKRMSSGDTLQVGCFSRAAAVQFFETTCSPAD